LCARNSRPHQEQRHSSHSQFRSARSPHDLFLLDLHSCADREWSRTASGDVLRAGDGIVSFLKKSPDQYPKTVG
jgi:hypothetical protein